MRALTEAQDKCLYFQVMRQLSRNRVEAKAMQKQPRRAVGLHGLGGVQVSDAEKNATLAEISSGLAV